MFRMLKKELLNDHERQLEKSFFYINNGFCKDWNEESKNFNDEGLRRYSTETRWGQYVNGTITREKAVEYAEKREEKKLTKKLNEKLEKLEKVSNAPDLEIASVYVDFIKSATWGYNPKVETYADSKLTRGSASGCGYDKESAAVAESFNKNYSFLKILYNLKEEALQKGMSAESKTSCTGVDNRHIVGYGAGYSVLPSFEGGVGVDCFWKILEKAGYKIMKKYGKRENTYIIHKEA